jgi:hypothetical protein
MGIPSEIFFSVNVGFDVVNKAVLSKVVETGVGDVWAYFQLMELDCLSVSVAGSPVRKVVENVGLGGGMDVEAVVLCSMLVVFEGIVPYAKIPGLCPCGLWFNTNEWVCNQGTYFVGVVFDFFVCAEAHGTMHRLLPVYIPSAVGVPVLYSKPCLEDTTND